MPALNEQESIADVVMSVRQSGFEILVIDDGSSDQTFVKAKSAGARVIDLSMNLGVGGALQSGFSYAIRNKFEAVVQLDADGQHPVSGISLIETANSQTPTLFLAVAFWIQRLK